MNTFVILVLATAMGIAWCMRGVLRWSSGWAGMSASILLLLNPLLATNIESSSAFGALTQLQYTDHLKVELRPFQLPKHPKDKAEFFEELSSKIASMDAVIVIDDEALQFLASCVGKIGKARIDFDTTKGKSRSYFGIGVLHSDKQLAATLGPLCHMNSAKIGVTFAPWSGGSSSVDATLATVVLRLLQQMEDASLLARSPQISKLMAQLANHQPQLGTT